MFIAEDMYKLGSQRSAIRELFEYGKQRAAVVGAENVYDFPLETRPYRHRTASMRPSVT